MKTEEGTLGPAGRLAQSFVRSKLTVLIALAAVALGALAVNRLAREEEPQISVPMFDVMVPMPGASAREVEEQLVAVGERKLMEIPGVEYVYTTAQQGGAFFIVRFKVGTDPERASTLVFAKTAANMELLAPGAGQPLVKPRSIDDVPILALTLSGGGLNPHGLRRAAAELRRVISTVDDVSDIEILGGRRRRFSVFFDPAALARRRMSPLDLAERLRAANSRLPVGTQDAPDRALKTEVDASIRSIEDLKSVVIGVSDGAPVRVGEVARVVDGPDDDEREVLIYEAGAAAPETAVTLQVSKRRGANATAVSRAALARVEEYRKVLPPTLKIAVTRDYGETAKNKSDELLFHMLLATLSVTALVAVALGLREALVVLIAVPVTLALTLMVYWLFGYTLNRITLFALIFSIGILVDDAIVVVENIHRHFAMRDGRPLWQVAVDAVDEVGNPTLLATWAVIAAILPMAFVGGLMGPYMRPIPVGASFAMLFSAFIAFVVSPWAFVKILSAWTPDASHAHAEEGRLDRLYRRVMGRLLDDGRARAGFLAGTVLLLTAALALVPLKAVVIKMLPFDDKDDFEVVLSMPEGSSLAATRATVDELSAELRKAPEVSRVVAYLGLGAPYNFNGLVRHYFLRNAPDQADLVVQLAPKGHRRQSHAVAKSLRAAVADAARRHGARVQVAEVPPGPPVLSTLVFEVYGPDAGKRADFARKLKVLLEKTPGITDVDTYVPDPEPLDRLVVDREKATLNGIAPVQVAMAARAAQAGISLDLAHVETEREPVDIRLRLPADERRTLDALRSVPLISRVGTPVTIGALTRTERLTQDATIHHKNLRPVSYVIADVGGRTESPVYALLDLKPRIEALAKDSGIEMETFYTRLPDDPAKPALKWDGEWQITYEVFRDMGAAFAMVLLLIYALVVAWFESFTVPLVIMAPIPLTLVGILPAHWAMGAFFTATSMIGFIAGAGIVVRNSIILVDFVELRRREGFTLRDAVIDAGAVRFRPMLLTAAAVVCGAAVILFDPIFQGLAVALMAGEVASTLLSRMAVPVLYYLLKRREDK
ncbi:MAG: efflux RND transporter permease subunit [Elusimicrobia bacterium]|nr:efflux RND transporter permease subunit [Elusimicrobiota bacterium]